MQEDLDEEECPEGFTLSGSIPEAVQADEKPLDAVAGMCSLVWVFQHCALSSLDISSFYACYQSAMQHLRQISIGITKQSICTRCCSANIMIKSMLISGALQTARCLSISLLCGTQHDCHVTCCCCNAGPSLAADDDDDCTIVEPKASRKVSAGVPASAGVLSDANGKRKRTADTSLGSDTEKKLKLSKANDDVIMLD